ncbi:MAG: hypothetical protein ACOVQN_00410 [Exiguobacterium sp.]
MRIVMSGHATATKNARNPRLIDATLDIVTTATSVSTIYYLDSALSTIDATKRTSTSVTIRVRGAIRS